MKAMTRVLVVVGVVALCATWSIVRGADQGDAVNTDAYAGLGSADAETRAGAIADLAKASTPKLSELQTALEDEPSLLVKAGIAEVIVARKPAESDMAMLSTSLLAHDVPTRLEAVRLLGRTRPESAIDALEHVVENRVESAEVRCAAAVALGRAGKDAAPALSNLAAAADLSPALRGAVLRGLALTGADGVKTVAGVASSTASDATTRDAAIAALREKDAPSTSALLGLLDSSIVAVKTAAAGALASRGENSTEIASALEGLLSDTSAAVRKGAVDALGRVGAAASKKSSILDLLSDASEDVQIAAITTLGKAFAGGDSDVADQLANLVDHDHFAIRYQAALALAALKDDRGLSAMKNPRASADDLERAASEDAAARITALVGSK